MVIFYGRLRGLLVPIRLGLHLEQCLVVYLDLAAVGKKLE